MDWNFKVVSGNRCPRQFEYHPTRQGMVFGTITGEVCAIDIYDGECKDNTCEGDGAVNPLPIKSLGYFGKNKNDTMLGLCWFRSLDTERAGLLYGESRSKSSLFLSGSSHGRVCLGDASRPYDRYDPDSYAIVHDYPTFDRMTSVHINSTNDLILMSGYATGVNVVDVETSQVVRKFEHIHRDHVNISRFSNLSPHLFATSSFDATIKTWDLRQPTGARLRNGASGDGQAAGDRDRAPSDMPIYTVNCGTGIVMINFSQDDNFILASALDNEINQYMFLDGRKHLTYNLPRTGLKSNFTRAYYSASGRHTLTGACEESTVKILCTYTGEPVTTVDLYPGKKDDSIYIQSLRGCPADEDQICVLANYRDMQTRELIMVSRNQRARRAAAADALLPAPGPAADEAPTVVTGQRDSARSVADWWPDTVRSRSATPDAVKGERPIYPSPGRHHLDAYQSDVSVQDTSFEVDDEMAEDGAEVDAFRPNNSLMCFYSAKYVEDMRFLYHVCCGLVHSYTLNADAGAMETGVQVPLELELRAHEGTSLTSCSDLAVLVHPNVTGPGPAWFILPVHTFVIKARCPALYQLCAAQQGVTSAVPSVARMTVTHAEEEVQISLPVIDVGPAPEPMVPLELLYLLPLLVDYLYTGAKTLDAITVRYYCLQKMLSEHCAAAHNAMSGLSAATISALLSPLVDDVLVAEMEEFCAEAANEKSSILTAMSTSADASDQLDESRTSRTYPNTTRTMFLPVQDDAAVEMLLKICVEDHCWRQNAALAVGYTAIVQQLLSLVQRLQLFDAVSMLAALLEQGLCPLNAVAVYDAAREFGCAELSVVVLRYITGHRVVFPSQLWEDRPDLTAAVTQMSDAHMADVVMRQTFKELKAIANRPRKGRKRASTLEVLTNYFTAGQGASDDGSGDDADQDSDDEPPAGTEELWQLEEVPYLPAIAPSAGATTAGVQESDVEDMGPDTTEATTSVPSRPAAVCLPRYIGAVVVPFMRDSVVVLAGQNLDRLHTYRNRILCYNYKENTFRFLSSGGSHVPKCGYMSCAAALQKGPTTHIIAFGGKIKKAEISVQHTTLPQHLRTTRAARSGLWEDLSPDHAREKGSGATVSAVTARHLSGINVDSRGPVSVVHNKLISVWNLNADREELSQPTAQAHAEEVNATLSALNTAVDQDGNPVRIPKAHQLLKAMGIIYELDCETLTWRSPAVEFCLPAALSTYQLLSPAARAQWENQVKEEQRALQCRVAQAVAPLHPEDVSYRGCNCLFSTFPAQPCFCSRRSGKGADAGDKEEGGMERTYIVQFGGYCDVRETITDDLYVLVCERTRFVPGSKASTPYRYKWVKVRATGTVPDGRFSHSMTTVPAQQELGRFLPLHDHTRMLVWGGTGFHADHVDLASLRINRTHGPRVTSAECANYAHWEEIVQTGSPPPRTQGHTMVYVPGTDMCVLYGGAYTGADGEAHNHCCPHVHLLQLVDAQLDGQLNTVLHVQWSRLRTMGVPPTLRSRHCSFAVAPAGHQRAQVMIFGGVDEAKLSRRQARNGAVLADYDFEIKDSVMHTLTLLQRKDPHMGYDASWLITDPVVAAEEGISAARSRVGRLLYFSSDPSVQVAECTLSRDMMSLLDGVFPTSNVTAADAQVDPTVERLKKITAEFILHRSQRAAANSSHVVSALEPQLNVEVVNTTQEGENQVTAFSLYRSLLCRRCAWFTTLLTSNMNNGQHDDAATTLYDVDPSAFRLLLLFIYADALMICSLQDVVAVLELANQFDLGSLARQCEGVLVRLTTLENVCELLDYADTLNLNVLKTACTALLLREVVGRGGNLGRDYAAMLFSDADGNVANVHLPAAGGGVGYESLLTEFRSLSAELRREIQSVFQEQAQVYGSATAGATSS